MGLFFVDNAPWIGFKGFLQYYQGTLQIGLFQDIGNAHLIDTCTWCSVETCGRCHHYGFALIVEFFKTPTAELLAVVNRKFCHGIESSHWYWRINTGYAVQTVNKAFSALHIFIVDITIVFLGRIQRGLGNNLSNEGRRESGLAEFHHGLSHFGILCYQCTNADATF